MKTLSEELTLDPGHRKVVLLVNVIITILTATGFLSVHALWYKTYNSISDFTSVAEIFGEKTVAGLLMNILQPLAVLVLWLECFSHKSRKTKLIWIVYLPLFFIPLVSYAWMHFRESVLNFGFGSDIYTEYGWQRSTGAQGLALLFLCLREIKRAWARVFYGVIIAIFLLLMAIFVANKFIRAADYGWQGLTSIEVDFFSGINLCEILAIFAVLYLFLRGKIMKKDFGYSYRCLLGICWFLLLSSLFQWGYARISYGRTYDEDWYPCVVLAAIVLAVFYIKKWRFPPQNLIQAENPNHEGKR